MIGLGITYSVTGGSSLHNFYGIVCHKNAMGECHSAGLSVWIVVFSAIHLFLIQVGLKADLTANSVACRVELHVLHAFRYFGTQQLLLGHAAAALELSTFAWHGVGYVKMLL